MTEKSGTLSSVLQKRVCRKAHSDAAPSSMRRVHAVGGLASTEFQMDSTNNNRVDVAFWNVGQSFQHTRSTGGSNYKAVGDISRSGVQWDVGVGVRKK